MENFNIAYASDDTYSKLLAVSISSLLRNNEDHFFNLYVFDCGIGSKSRNFIGHLVSQYNNGNINWIDVDTLLQKEWKTSQVYSKAIYARLFIDKLPLTVHRLLYLDSDTIINQDITNLLETDLKDAAIYGKAEPKKFCIERSQALNYNFANKYINSGVLLIDLDKWRTQEYSSKIKNYLTNYSSSLAFPDQDAINIICKERINSTMEHTYNAKYIGGGLTECSILHYGGTAARANLKDFRNVYLPYLNNTEWYKEKELIRCDNIRKLKDRIWIILLGQYIPFGNTIYRAIMSLHKK